MLWPNSLGLYRLSARDALFVRKDVAELVLGEDWRPADEWPGRDGHWSHAVPAMILSISFWRAVYGMKYFVLLDSWT